MSGHCPPPAKKSNNKKIPTKNRKKTPTLPQPPPRKSLSNESKFYLVLYSSWSKTHKPPMWKCQKGSRTLTASPWDTHRHKEAAAEDFQPNPKETSCESEQLFPREPWSRSQQLPVADRFQFSGLSSVSQCLNQRLTLFLHLINKEERKSEVPLRRWWFWSAGQLKRFVRAQQYLLLAVFYYIPIL